MSPPTSILHLISRLDRYGGARMLRHLATRQAERGTAVAIAALVADPHVARELRDAGIEVQAFQCRGRWDVVAQARLVRLASQPGVDVVHAWDARTLALATLAGRRRLAPPCVATLGWADANRSWTSRVVTRAGRRVAGFAASDEATRSWLLAAGVAAERVTTVSPGAAWPSAPTRTRADVLDELALPPDAPLIAVVASLVRSKRLDETIWHFELVRVLHPNARLLIIGDGPDRARLERFANQVSEPDAVRFLGVRNDPAELLAHVDVYWQLSTGAATPWALLEALAAGAPVVAADVPAHRAVIDPNETGRLVPVDRAEVTRATDELLADPAAAKRMGQAAAERIIAEWSLDKSLDAYGELYARALVPAGIHMSAI